MCVRASRTASAVGVQLRKHIGAETFVRMFDTVYKLTRHPILQQPAFEVCFNTIIYFFCGVFYFVLISFFNIYLLLKLKLVGHEFVTIIR